MKNFFLVILVAMFSTIAYSKKNEQQNRSIASINLKTFTIGSSNIPGFVSARIETESESTGPMYFRGFQYSKKNIICNDKSALIFTPQIQELILKAKNDTSTKIKMYSIFTDNDDNKCITHIEID